MTNTFLYAAYFIFGIGKFMNIKNKEVSHFTYAIAACLLMLYSIIIQNDEMFYVNLVLGLIDAFIFAHFYLKHYKKNHAPRTKNYSSN